MKVIRSIHETKEEMKARRRQGQIIGFVPTMGALHQGHLSLVAPCKKENDVTAASIFVNPAQFGPDEDFARYPRDYRRDEGLLKELGVDIIFYPTVEEIYPPGYSTYVEVERLANLLCGKSRPGHFRGVATVVLKLFHIVSPDNAYFGQKDAQQAILLKRMVTDLNLDVKLKVMPIVRDEDGLALSSRNVYLSRQERQAALHLPRALDQAKKNIREGLKHVSRIKAGIEEELTKNPLVTIDYVEVVRLDTLEPFPGPPEAQVIDSESTLAAAAVRVGKTRLIDNFILGEI
jgi:pantoate--beta-alanine ligase